MIGPLDKTTTQAAASKDLVDVMVEICEEFNTGSQGDQHRLAAYVCLRDIYHTLRHTGRVPSKREFKLVSTKYEPFLVHYHKCVMIETRRGRMTYNETFKFHMGWHIIDMARYENPILCNEYMWEDLMGKVARVGRACTSALTPTRLAFKILQKIRIATAVFLGQAPR